MDNISGLPDDILGRILSLVPTKVAVSTSILSKRWKFLWMWLPKLDFIDRDDSLLVLKDFINKNLPLHRAPVIESLRLSLYETGEKNIKPEDIRLWVEIAVSHHLRELDVSFSADKKENMVSNSLFTCKSLVILKLRFLTLMDVPSTACLPSLKTLLLELVIYEDKEAFESLLSICPVLEDLEVRFDDENVQEFTINVPSLRKLFLHISDYRTSVERYEIDTPCLEYLKLADWNDCECLVKNMSKLKKAHVDVASFASKNVIGSVKSVKHLTVCSEDLYGGDGIVFDQLEHLELCICRDVSSNLLAQFLKDCPNLRVLGLSQLDLHADLMTNEMGFWNQPSSVPECLLSSLQILNWIGYFGRPQERDIAVYILRNARHLRTATFWANTLEHDDLEMIKELTLSSRASSTCELVFIEGL